MEKDIVERLRDASGDPYFRLTGGVEEWLQTNWNLREEAANEINILREEIGRLKKRVEAFEHERYMTQDERRFRP